MLYPISTQIASGRKDGSAVMHKCQESDSGDTNPLYLGIIILNVDQTILRNNDLEIPEVFIFFFLI